MTGTVNLIALSIYQYSNMAQRLSGRNFWSSVFSLYPSLSQELRDKKNLKKLQFRRESLEAMLEYSYDVVVTTSVTNDLAPVVQKLDNAIHRINRYPVDKR